MRDLKSTYIQNLQASLLLIYNFMSTLWLIDKASPYDICSDQQNYLHNANIMTLCLTEQGYKTDVRQKTENEILKWDK